MAKKLTTPSLFNINDLPTAKASKPVQKNEISLIEELHDDFLIYANEVNTNRAFPDVRDGLKISQRAVLWEMYNKGYSSSKPHVKSAKVDGGVIANWHPHGSEYLTLVRMSQSWVNNICEIDFHGGNGSLLGGPEAAHARYT
jgi:DNA gyrase subunit A